MAPRKRALPAPLPDGFILTDTEKKRWKLGKIIGQGGFGLIYLASQDVDTPVREDSDFVIKVEYHENGPLFSELKFYQRAAKPEKMKQWMKSKKLDFLGIPAYWGSGLAEYDGTRYRFMVMDRLGSDLQKVFEQNGGRLKYDTVLQLGRILLDVLEYVHDNEYVHADIKAANLMLGHRDPDKVYLADYGLSYRYCPDGVHKEYKENPKKGHNGTIEYTSVDAHNGVVPSRRGDLQVLGFCLLHWLCGALPWDSVLKNPSQVQEAKVRLMDNLPSSVQRLSVSGASTDKVSQFLLSVKALEYQERPDYNWLRELLSEGGLRGSGGQGGLDLSGLDLSGLQGKDAGRSAARGSDGQARNKKTGRAKAAAKGSSTAKEEVEGREEEERPRPISACYIRGPPIGPSPRTEQVKTASKNKKPIRKTVANKVDLTVTSTRPEVNQRKQPGDHSKTRSRANVLPGVVGPQGKTSVKRSERLGEVGADCDDPWWENGRIHGHLDQDQREDPGSKQKGCWNVKLYTSIFMIVLLLAFLLAVRGPLTGMLKR